METLDSIVRVIELALFACIVPPVSCFIAYRLAKTRGYPNPTGWVLLAIVPAVSLFTLPYLFFRKPYRVRFPAETYARESAIERGRLYRDAIRAYGDGEFERARPLLKRLVEDHPDSEQAEEARTILEVLDQAGAVE